MKLRNILFALSMLAFLSTVTGGYLYYTALKKAELTEAHRQAEMRIQVIEQTISQFLSENIRPIQTLSGMPPLAQFLSDRDAESMEKVNTILDHFNATLEVDVCYLMDSNGKTIASSNRHAPDSFVDKNFAFRPYFQKAIQGKASIYMALGLTSNKRGVYYSRPVYTQDQVSPAGIAVIKSSIDQIENRLVTGIEEIVVITNPWGVIFISNRKDWLYHSLFPLSPGEKEAVATSQQFGKGPWNWIGVNIHGSLYATDQQGHRYLLKKITISTYPDWQIVYLLNQKAVFQKVSGSLLKVSGTIVLSFCLLISSSVYFLYRKASRDIRQRKIAEKALRKSEERYRTIYHNAPAMLHSINTEGRLIGVSDHWLKAMGYDREEVIGRGLTRFLTEASVKHLLKTVMPEFFKTGVVKDMPYQFVKKDGQIIDTLVSAYGERDEDGNIIRSLAVSIDITERRKAEKALKHAKEKLSQYSKDLEQQVKKRTREITNILRYSPSLIYIKGSDGKYLLINTKFEALFNIQNMEIRGKTDHDIFPDSVAIEMQQQDRKVIEENKSFQVEELLPHNDGLHTYLSVKFPMYNDAGDISGVGSISTDVTLLKKAQDQLRRLSGSIMDNQEKERAALARELHDELGQLLTALRLDSVWLARHLKAKDAEASERATDMCGLIDKTIEDVRGLAIRLRPGVLDTLGLVDALEWYTTDFEKRTGIPCLFEHKQIPSIDGTLATVAYRITQEALTNVARHADADRVDVRLKVENSHLILTVSDDGKGVSPSELSDTEALGIVGMQERASLVGGELAVHTAADKGTRVCLSVLIGNQHMEA